MELNNNSVLFKHPQIYTDKIVTTSTADERLNDAFFLYTAHSGIMVCDHRVIDIVRKSNGVSSFLDIANIIDASVSEVEEIVKYLVQKGVLSIDYPILPQLEFGDALEASDKGTYAFWIHITNDCNLRCKYCYINKNVSTIQFSELETIIMSIISSLKRHNAKKLILKISGGEPLTNFATVKHLVDCVNEKHKESTDLSVHFELLTNGTIISEQIIEFIKQNDISVSISLDSVNGSDEEARIFVDGKGSTELVKNNIDTYIANEIFPRIMVTVNSDNISQLPSLTEYLIEKKLCFRFSLQKDCNDSIPSIISHAPKLIASLNECFTIMETALINHNFGWQFKFNNIKFGMPRERSCSAGTHFFAIGASGEFASCGLGLSLNGHHVADEEDLIDALQDYYKDFYDKNTICQRCNWSSCCANDCPIQSEYCTTSNGVSPFCSILQVVIPRLLKLDALKIYMRCNGKK